jgi:hypothetical protein
LRIGDFVGKFDISYGKLNQPSYLQKLFSAKIKYDKVVNIKTYSDIPTVSIEMEPPHKTFLIDGIITHNSTTLANIMLVDSLLYPHFRSLYVSPTVDQTKVFSNDRVAPVMEHSPFIKKHFLSAALNQNVFTKQFKNGSKIYMRYALQSADRLRGISADANFFDECFAEGTQVLTDKGWVNFEDLTEENLHQYKFATASLTHKLEYQKASRLISREYEGDILEFCDYGGISIRVTPNHNMYVYPERKTCSGFSEHPWLISWKFVKAWDLGPQSFQFLSALNPYGDKRDQEEAKKVLIELFEKNNDNPGFLSKPLYTASAEDADKAQIAWLHLGKKAIIE